MNLPANTQYTFTFINQASGLLEIFVQTVTEYRLSAVISVRTMLNLMADSEWQLVPYRITDQGGTVCLKYSGGAVYFSAPVELVLDVLDQCDEFSLNDIDVEE